MNEPTQDQILAAIKVLTAAGAVVSLNAQTHLSLGSVAQRLDCGKGWVRDHLNEFPGAWRMPGGELRIPETDVAAAKQRVALGELRIPARDIEALARRNRLQPAERKEAA